MYNHSVKTIFSFISKYSSDSHKITLLERTLEIIKNISWTEERGCVRDDAWCLKSELKWREVLQVVSTYILFHC